MYTLLLAALATSVVPGPVDAFRANHASIKADVDFEYAMGFVDPATITGRKFWSDSSFSFVEIPESRLVGRWSCDGLAEYYFFSSPEDVIASAAKKPAERLGTKSRRQYVPKIEAIYDGTHYIGHTIDDYSQGDPRIVHARSDSQFGLIFLGKGPFYWWLEHPFPHILDAKFPGVTPVVKSEARAGYPTEVEIYRTDYPLVRYQLESSYDPSIGFLPRFAREVYGRKGGASHVKELYLMKAEQCSAGGFIPTEWYESEFATDVFPENYDDTSILTPNARVLIGHFKATKPRDRKTPVALAHLKRVHSIEAVGGIMPLSPRGTLSITETRSMLGRKLTDSQRSALPSLDVNELEEFKGKPVRKWRILVVGTLSVLIGIVAAWNWRRRGRRLCIGTLVALSGTLPGCSPPARTPIVKLTAALVPDRVLYDLQPRPDVLGHGSLYL